MGRTAIDETGKRYGRLSVLGRSSTSRRDGLTVWTCRCACGKTIEVAGANLRRRPPRSCGCLPRLDETGNRYGRLTVLGRSSSPNQERPVWDCACDCGKTTSVCGKNLRNGNTISCGCARIAAATTHGLSKHPDYHVWVCMMHRCYNADDAAYQNYGGRGIKVAERWWTVENFLADMGPRPLGWSLERVDVDGDYTLENCIWIPKVDQSKNRRTSIRVDWDGESRLLCELASAHGITPRLARERVKNGWDLARALTTGTPS